MKSDLNQHRYYVVVLGTSLARQHYEESLSLVSPVSYLLKYVFLADWLHCSINWSLNLDHQVSVGWNTTWESHERPIRPGA